MYKLTPLLYLQPEKRRERMSRIRKVIQEHQVENSPLHQQF